MRINRFLLIASLFIAASCQDAKVDVKTKGTAKLNSAKYNAIIANIDNMGNNAWDTAVYNGILKKQFAFLKGNEKRSAAKKLNNVYANVLVHDADSIMNTCCASHHKRGGMLDNLIAEYQSHVQKNKEVNVDDKNIIDRKKKHDDVVSFIYSTANNRQRVTNYTDRYDNSFEENARTKAARYKSEGYTCSYIGNELNNIQTSGYFNARKKDYCDKIYNLFTAQKNTVQQKNIISTIGGLVMYEKINSSVYKNWKDNLLRFPDFIEFAQTEPEENISNVIYFGDKYDMDFERDCLNKAKNYLRIFPNMYSGYKQKMQKIQSNDYFTKRRRQYCQMTIVSYQALTNKTPEHYKKLKECLKCYDASEKYEWLRKAESGEIIKF